MNKQTNYQIEEYAIYKYLNELFQENRLIS